jgi:hypothetical protein
MYVCVYVCVCVCMCVCVQDHLFSLKAEMGALQRTVRHGPAPTPHTHRGSGSGSSGSGGGRDSHDTDATNTSASASTTAAAAAASQAQAAEWRAALADVSTALRRELAGKAGREEVQNALCAELETLDTRFQVSA